MKTLTSTDLFDTEALPIDSSDEQYSLTFDASSLSFHSLVYRHLETLCDSPQQAYSDDELQASLTELHTCLIEEMRTFLTFKTCSIGRGHILRGLELLSEACLVARYAEQRNGLATALKMARRGDGELRLGQQLKAA